RHTRWPRDWSSDVCSSDLVQQKLKDRFAQWIWENPTRTERLARLYNDTFNSIRLRTYDGSHLTFPGMNRTGLRNNDLDPHQKNRSEERRVGKEYKYRGTT